MIKHFVKNHFLILLLLGLTACSSNTNVGQDDLSISEIEDIEKTGEFSEDDFFKDEEILKENNVTVDIEGLDDTNINSFSNDLVSDVDIEDFEGEGFDQKDDFETNLESDNSVAEFDEFDEFVTDEKVAKNEDFMAEEAPQIGDIAEEPTMTEEDIFSEFEESTDVGSSDTSIAQGETPTIDDTMLMGEATPQPELDFEDAFQESAPVYDDQIADNSVDVDTMLDTDIGDYQGELTSKQMLEQNVATETPEFAEENFDSDFGPGTAPVIDIVDVQEERTAKEILGNDYEMPEQIITQIKREVRSWIPVKKMADEPFERSGILLNALYVVRQGDSFNDISEKIYGSGSTSNLAAVNPFVKPSRLKVGEKIYYNSPNRPNDRNTMLFYYDDVGRVPQYKQIAMGQNIRAVAQELLGHPRSWMEIWATNPEMVSKGEADRDYRVKYFSKNSEQTMVNEAGGTNFSGSASNQDTFNEEPADQVATSLGDEEGLPEELPAFDEPVEPNANQQAQENTDFDQGFDQPVVGGGMDDTGSDFDQGFDDPAANQQIEEPPRDAIADIPQNLDNQFQESSAEKGFMGTGLDQKMVETIAMGVGGLLLLVVLLLVARRRRQYARATQVNEFDFAGNTNIDEQTKTHIDI